MPFKVVPATIRHAPQIADVHIGTWRTSYRGIVADETLANLDLEARVHQWSSVLSEVHPNTCTFVAVDENEKVAGFAAGGPVRDDELHADSELYAIYLHSQLQRRGIGKALFDEVVRFLDKNSFTSLGVWVLERNPSRGFYEALGGKVVAEKMIIIDELALKEIGYRWGSLQGLLNG